MRGKRARKLRKAVYGDKDYRQRTYGQLEGTGTIVNIEPGQKVANRRLYRRFKRLKIKVV
jgi:hypothetical protein